MHTPPIKSIQQSISKIAKAHGFQLSHLNPKFVYEFRALKPKQLSIEIQPKIAKKCGFPVHAIARKIKEKKNQSIVDTLTVFDANGVWIPYTFTTRHNMGDKYSAETFEIASCGRMEWTGSRLETKPTVIQGNKEIASKMVGPILQFDRTLKKFDLDRESDLYMREKTKKAVELVSYVDHSDCFLPPKSKDFKNRKSCPTIS